MATQDEQQFQFDKFMDDIIIDEQKTKAPITRDAEDSPIRKLNKRHRERPNNRITFGPARSK
jgi:hypothetical protein